MFRICAALGLSGLLFILGTHDASAHGFRWPRLSFLNWGHRHDRVELTRPDPAPDADAQGHLHLKEHRGRSAISVHLKNLDAGTYAVRIRKGEETAALGDVTIAPRDPPVRRPRCFKATLSGAQEVPAVETQATGKAKFVLWGRDRTTLRYQVNVEGLSGAPTAAHIHKGAPGESGDVLIPLDHEDLKGSVEITAEQLAEIESGKTYVNVHTEKNGAGEIRGQIVPCHDPEDDHEEAPDRGGSGKLRIDTGRGDKLPFGAASLSDLNGSTVEVLDSAGAVVLSGQIEDFPAPPPPPPPPAARCLKTTLSGDQEVPAVDTEAGGKGRLFLGGRDRTELFYWIMVEGLSGPATAAHLHSGAPGAEGDVLIPLDHDDLDGKRTFMDGRAEVTAEHVAALESGNTYVNIHTEKNPEGEVRGQVVLCEAKPPEEEGGAGDEAPLGSLSDFEEFAFDVSGRHDAAFLRGDVNTDGGIDLGDALSALFILYGDGATPYCQDAVDANDDGSIDLSDAVGILRSLFLGTGPLPAPGADGVSGFDPTEDTLYCDETR